MEATQRGWKAGGWSLPQEAFQLLPMWRNIWPEVQPEETQEDPHGRETLHVFRMRSQLQTEEEPGEARQVPHGDVLVWTLET